MAQRPPPSSFSLRRAIVHVPARLGIPAALALTVFLLGPRVQVDEEVEPVEVQGDPAAWVARAEADVPGIRPGDEAGIVWADPEVRERTPVALVYLHGFSADRHEMDPVPQRIAGTLGANLYLPRLTGHGRDGAAMAEASARDWFQDAAEAVAVGRALGERVVLMGTSTGGTLALWAAARPGRVGQVAGLVLLSPNLGLADRDSRLLLMPWGGLLARAFLGPERCFEPASPEQERHWTTCYPVEALLPMMGLVERVRTLDPEEITTPALVLYSPDDQVVDPAAIQEYAGRLGSAPRRLVAVEVDAPGRHVLAGDIAAPGNNDRVVELVVAFLAEAGLAPR